MSIWGRFLKNNRFSNTDTFPVKHESIIQCSALQSNQDDEEKEYEEQKKRED